MGHETANLRAALSRAGISERPWRGYAIVSTAVGARDRLQAGDDSGAAVAVAVRVDPIGSRP